MKKVIILVSLAGFYFVVPVFLFSPAQAQGPQGTTIGEIVMWPSYSIPNGWLQCDGSIVAQADYPELYEIISSTFGSAPANYFYLPNLEGRFVYGRYGGLEPVEIGDVGGETEHTLTLNEIPEHRHMLGRNNLRATDGGATLRAEGWSYISTAYTYPAGGGEAHNNMPPWIALNFIIAYTTTSVITPTPTNTPTPTPTNTPTPTSTPIGATSVISVYTYTLDSGTVLTVPAQITTGQILLSTIGLGLLAVFVLIFTFRLIYR
jgi:microcystin-dependent protein